MIMVLLCAALLYPNMFASGENSMEEEQTAEYAEYAEFRTLPSAFPRI